MPDFARLGIAVDSRSAKTANTDLGRLGREGRKASDSADGLTRSTNRTRDAQGRFVGQTRKATKAVSGMDSAFGGLIRRMALAAGAYAGVSKVSAAAEAYNKMTNSLRAMGIEAGQTAGMIDRISEIANRTRTPLEATAQLYQRISIAGRDLGASQQEVLRFTENVGLALAQTGSSASESSGALLQLSQAMAGGTVRAEEFNSILEGAFPIAQAAADGIDAAGGSVGRLRQLVVDGKVSSDEFFNAILSQTDQLEEAFGNTEATMSQAFTVLGNNLTTFVGEMDAATGASSAVADVILLLANNLDSVAGIAIAAGVAVAGIYAPAITGAVTATYAWVTSLVTLRGALMATGIGALVVGAGLLIGWFIKLVRATGGWGEALSLLGEVASGVWEGIKASASAVIPAIGALWADMHASFVRVLQDMSLAWGNFLWGLGSRLDGVPFFDGMAQGLKDASDRAIDSVVELDAKASGLEGTAIRLRQEASSLATTGFDTASAAAAKLTAQVEGTTDATLDSEDASSALNSALDKVNKGAGKAAKGLKKVKTEAEAFAEAMEKAAYTTEDFGKEKANTLVSGIDGISGAWGDFVSRGFSDFKGFVDNILDSFKGMLSQMITMAARNQIMIGLGFGGSVVGSGASVGGVAQSGGGFGSSLLGGAGNFLSGGASLFGTGGFVPGVWSGLQGVFTGGGLGSSVANLGGLATGASSGAGAFGAALPALGIAIVGIAALVKGLSREYDGKAVRGALGPDGFEGFELDFWDGGWLRGDKEVHSDVRAEIQDMLDGAAHGIRDNVELMAESLGLASDAIHDFTGEGFTIWLTGQNAGSAEDIQAQFEAQLATLGDGMAELVLTTDQFGRAGETTYDTLSRLGSSLIAVNDAMDLLQGTAFDTSLIGGDAASHLVDAFGGLEAMTVGISTYWQSFYTEAERQDETLRRMQEQFRELGVAMPESREGFRAMVEAIDLTSEAGRQLYADLIGLSGAMDAVLGPLFGVSPEIAALIDQATSLIDGQISERQELARTLEGSSRLWLRTAETLRNFLVDLRTTSLGGLSPAQILEASAMRYSDLFGAARGGDQAAAQDFLGGAKAYLSAVRDNAGSLTDYRRAAMQVERDSQLLAGITEFEGAKDQYLSDLYEAQIDVLQDMKVLLASGNLTAEALDGLNGTLGELQEVIEAADMLSYDYLQHNLDLVLDLIPTADIPENLRNIIEAAGGSLETLIDLVFRDEDLTPGMRFLLAGETLNGLGVLDLSLAEANTRIATFLAGGVLDGSASLIAEIAAGTPAGLAGLLSEGVFSGEALLSGRIIGENAAARILRQIGRATTNWIEVGGEFEFDPSRDLQNWFSNALADGVSDPISGLGATIGGLDASFAGLSASLQGLVSELQAEQQRTAAAAASAARVSELQGKVEKFDNNWGAESLAKTSGAYDKVQELVAATGVTLSGLRIKNDGTVAYNSSGVSGTESQLAAFRASGFWDDGGLQDQITAVNRNRNNALAYEDRLQDRLAAAALPAFANGTSFAPGGRALVGELGPEVVDLPRGSVVHPYSQSKSMLDQSDLLSEMRAMRREMASLRAENARAQAKIAKNTGSVARIERERQYIPQIIKVEAE